MQHVGSIVVPSVSTKTLLTTRANLPRDINHENIVSKITLVTRFIFERRLKHGNGLVDVSNCIAYVVRSCGFSENKKELT